MKVIIAITKNSTNKKKTPNLVNYPYFSQKSWLEEYLLLIYQITI